MDKEKMQDKVTRYFHNAVIATTQRSIVFNQKEYCIATEEDLAYGQIQNIALFQQKFRHVYEIKYKEKDSNSITTNEETIDTSKVVDFLIATKVIKTEFLHVVKKESGISELTSVFFMPVRINYAGELMCPAKNKTAWIPREFLAPMVDEQLAIADEEACNQYLEDTTPIREQCKEWTAFYQYWTAYFDSVTEAYRTKNDDKVVFDNNCCIFLDDTFDSLCHIKGLYEYLVKNPDTENLLYRKITNGCSESQRELISNTDLDSMKKHAGQMSGKYSLSPSQREAMHHFNVLEDGDILAVSGPPGTGKTTLLQSIVADMFVQRALNGESAPIIVASSTNNQAVTNIIDSFNQIESLGLDGLDKKWLSDTDSFAVYLPSEQKLAQGADKYQYMLVRDKSGFYQQMEATKENAKETFLNEYNKHFRISFKNLNSCKKSLQESIKDIDDRRCNILLRVKNFKSKIGNGTYRNYLLMLKQNQNDLKGKQSVIQQKIEQQRKDRKEYEVRSHEWEESYACLPWYVRWLSFFPLFKNRIIQWSYDFMEDYELQYLKRGMNLIEIQEKYRSMIDGSDKAVRKLMWEDIEISKQLNNNVETEKQMEIQFQYLEDFLEKERYITHVEQKQKCLDDFDLNTWNDTLDQLRYAEFWYAVHYFECCWLMNDKKLSEAQLQTNCRNVMESVYSSIVMLAPCMVMTLFMLPKNFKIYENKKDAYMNNYVDLLILDEAGQISPEIAAAAFSLAKKAVIVGDEKQIPPVWNIDKAIDISLAKTNHLIHDKSEFEQLVENGLNCSESSIMKIAALSCAYNKHGQGLFLSEHRRCYDEIIAYCNELVYGNYLQPLRGSAENTDNVLRGILPAMGHYQISSEHSESPGFSRKNSAEARVIVEWLQENFELLCEYYEKSGKHFSKKSLVGVITPFKLQANIIKKSLKQCGLGSYISVGTVHTFQGAERNIIIFSSVYGAKDGCYFIDKQKNLMNVAVSRAKDSFLVFGEKECLKKSGNYASALLRRNLQDMHTNI